MAFLSWGRRRCRRLARGTAGVVEMTLRVGSLLVRPHAQTDTFDVELLEQPPGSSRGLLGYDSEQTWRGMLGVLLIMRSQGSSLRPKIKSVQVRRLSLSGHRALSFAHSSVMLY